MFSNHWILLPSLGAVILVEPLCGRAYTETRSISIAWTWIIASHPGAPSTVLEEDKGVNGPLPAAGIVHCSPWSSREVVVQEQRKETREDDGGCHLLPVPSALAGRYHCLNSSVLCTFSSSLPTAASSGASTPLLVLPCQALPSCDN